MDLRFFPLKKRFKIWTCGLYCKLWGFKNLEIESRFNRYIFSLGISFWYRPKGDHKGWFITLDLGPIETTIEYYDSRHEEKYI